MITIDTSKKYNGDYNLRDCFVEETKDTLRDWALVLGLKVPANLKKADFAERLEQQILEHPEIWLPRLTRYELELMQSLVKAGKNGSVSDKMPMDGINADDMCLMTSHKDEDDHTTWHYTMPNALRTAVEPYLDKILADPIYKKYFDLQQYVLGIMMLYGLVPSELMFVLMRRYTIECQYDDQTEEIICKMLFNSLLVQYGGQYDYQDENDEIATLFVSPVLRNIERLMTDLDQRSKIEYKIFTTAEYMAAGQIPLHPFPCKGYHQALDAIAPYHENEEECRYILRDVWYFDQNNFDMMQLMQFFLPVNIKKSKINACVAAFQKFLNTIPRWILKGHCSEEASRMIKRSGPPKITLGPNLKAAGFELNPDFQKYIDEEWTDPDSVAEFDGSPFVRKEEKIGRNDPCPCGSGKKYKNCCGKKK